MVCNNCFKIVICIQCSLKLYRTYQFHKGCLIIVSKILPQVNPRKPCYDFYRVSGLSMNGLDQTSSFINYPTH